MREQLTDSRDSVMTNHAADGTKVLQSRSVFMRPASSRANQSLRLLDRE
jgi:hypothetical protein